MHNILEIKKSDFKISIRPDKMVPIYDWLSRFSVNESNIWISKRLATCENSANNDIELLKITSAKVNHAVFDNLDSHGVRMWGFTSACTFFEIDLVVSGRHIRIHTQNRCPS